MYQHAGSVIDVREDSRAQFKMNYADWKPEGHKPWLIITNPPFSHATEIADKALREVADGGFVVMLQRLNWLGSAKRQSFWGRWMPKWVFIHRSRISFNGTKNADSNEYAHFVWQGGGRVDYPRIVLLDTPRVLEL